MKRRTRLLLFLVVLLGVPILLTWRAVRQERLDRALIVAVEKNDAAHVISLLAQGADANARDLLPDTRPFWQQIVDRVRDKQKKESKKESLTQSALYLAISWPPSGLIDGSPYEVLPQSREANLTVVNALLDHGADVNSKSHGWLFVIPNNTEPAKEIEDAGYTPLMEAVMQDRKDFVKLLLQHGADPNIKGSQGITALTLAGSGRSSIIQMLKQAGAKE